MKRLISSERLPLLATLAVFVLLFGAASLRYHDRAFLSVGTFADLLRGNAMLGVAAIGMTFVILSAGIDLWVGGMVGFPSIGAPPLVMKQGWPPVRAALVPLALGPAAGALMGTLVQAFALPPFLVTLAGMFLLRGL